MKSTPELYLDMKLVIEDKEYYKESGFNAWSALNKSLKLLSSLVKLTLWSFRAKDLTNSSDRYVDLLW